MFKLFTTIGTLALVAFVSVQSASAASYNNAAYYDAKLSITKRLNDGTMLPRVRAIQTITINGKKYVSEPAIEKNMGHLWRVSWCSVRPENCKKSSVWEL